VLSALNQEGTTPGWDSLDAAVVVRVAVILVRRVWMPGALKSACRVRFSLSPSLQINARQSLEHHSVTLLRAGPRQRCRGEHVREVDNVTDRVEERA
jgi:hypothetical protein